MICSFAAYLLLVSVLLSTGAWATEQSFIARRWPRRFLWLASLLASVLLPVGMALSTAPVHTAVSAKLPAQLEAVSLSAMEHRQAQGQQPTQAKPAVSPAAPVAPQSSAGISSARPSFDQLASILWLSSSIVTALWYVLAARRLAGLLRCARFAIFQGVSVRITSAGPAVFGVFRPEILWPSWLADAPAATQAAALAHETQHLAARDPLLLAVGLCLVALAPWNPALWWQLRRMRFAMEADCDWRVVRCGTDESVYAGALLQIAQARMAGGAGLAMLMSAPSWLEGRVRVLLHAPGRRGVLLAAMGVPLALGAWAAVAQLPAPSLHVAELRMLPPEDIRPGAEWARAVARSRYPELFNQHFDGTAVVAAIFNSNGTLRVADKHLYAPDVPPPDLDMEIENQRAGIEFDNDGYYAGQERGQYTIGPWLNTVNAGRVFVVYEVLAREPDPSRSAARAEAALRAYAPEVFAPQDPLAQERLSQVTLFMNDDGTVARMSKFTMAFGKSYQIPAPVDRFAAMGIPEERLGRSGTFAVGDAQVVYSWPKHPDEPPDQEPWSAYPSQTDQQLQLPDPREDRSDEARINERYFHELQLNGSEAITEVFGRKKTMMTPWVLLGRDGRVWDAGFLHNYSDPPPGYDYQYPTSAPVDRRYEEIEDRYPGIRVQFEGPGWLVAGMHVATAWIAPDSPIQNKANVDMHRRKDFLVTGALVSVPDGPVPTGGFPYALVAAADLNATAEMNAMIVPRFAGGPLGRYAQFRNERGSGVEVTVIQADRESIKMNVHVRPLLWAGLPGTQTVQVDATYGRATPVDVPGDTPGQTTRLVLRVERLKQ